MYIHDKYTHTHTQPHNHTNSHTNNYHECPIEMDDMIHRLETMDGSVGQFLRPVGMMYNFQNTNSHTSVTKHRYNFATTAF